MSKIKLNKPSQSMTFKDYDKNGEAFEEKIKEIAPDKVRQISEILNVNTVKRNFLFSHKIFKLKKKSESVNLVKYSDFRLKQDDIESNIKKYEDKVKINTKKFLKLKDENKEFLKKYNFFKKAAIEKKVSTSILKSNPEFTFRDLINKYDNKGYKVTDLSMKKNIFTPNPLLTNNKNSHIQLNHLNTYIKIKSDTINKNQKSIKYMEKLNARIIEKQNLNKKNFDNENKRIAFILKKYPTLHIKNDYNKTDVQTDFEKEKIENDINQLREIEKKLDDKKSIRLKKEQVKRNSNLQLKNKSVSNFEITTNNLLKNKNRSFSPKSFCLNNRSSYNNNQNNNIINISSENFSKLNSNFNSNLNSGRKTCTDSTNISKYGSKSGSKFDYEKTKKFRKTFNSEYLNYALNSVNLDAKKKEFVSNLPSMTHSFFCDFNKKESLAKDLYDKVEKYSQIEDAANHNYEDIVDYFKEKKNMINSDNQLKDLFSNLSDINLKLNKFNICERFNKTCDDGFNFNINMNRLKYNNSLDTKIKKLDKEIIKKIYM